MTSNLNAIAGSFADTAYNMTRDGLNEVYNRGLYNVTSDGASAVYNQGVNAFYEHKLYRPYNIGLAGSKLINSIVGTTVGLVGEAAKVAFSEHHRAASSSALAGCAFGYLTFNGLKMVIDPIWCEYIEFDYRFKSKLELKGKLENLGELVNKISPDVLPGTAQVNAIAGVTAYQANKTAEDLKAEADNAKEALDTANRIINEAEPALLIANTAQENANALKLQSDQTQEIVDQRVNALNILDIESLNLMADAEVAKQLSDDAKTNATELMKDPTIIAANEYRPLLQGLKTKAEETKKAAEAAKKQSETAKKQTEIPKKKEESELLPEANYFLNYKVEKSKQKPDEYHLWLPMSNNALIFKWDVFKKSIKTSLAGIPTITLGALGVIDSISKYAVETSVAKELSREGVHLFANTTANATLNATMQATVNATMNATANATANIMETAQQTIANQWLGDTGETIVHIIGSPVQLAAGIAGNAVAWVASADTYGLSRLTAAAALGYGGYSLFKGGLLGYKPIDGVWYDIKKAKADETIFTTARYTLNSGVILRDIGKAAAGTAMIGAAILSFHDFFSGNYSSW